ncbi:MAG: hypoxanthine phosphoribosyltransferase [Candidatus Hydrogenedens sp.]
MQLIFPPLIRKEQIRQKVSELAEKIRKDMDIEYFYIVVILKGAVFFATDLLRELPPVASLDFIQAESYQGCNSRGEVRIFDNHISNVKGKRVLLIEDIFDTGLTTQKIVEYLKEQGAKDIHLCVLLKKKKYREGVTISSDYVGFYIEDNFVVGYGMDYNGKFRNLPDIHILNLE